METVFSFVLFVVNAVISRFVECSPVYEVTRHDDGFGRVRFTVTNLGVPFAIRSAVAVGGGFDELSYGSVFLGRGATADFVARTGTIDIVLDFADVPFDLHDFVKGDIRCRRKRKRDDADKSRDNP